MSRQLREELATANETLHFTDGLLLTHGDRDRKFAQTWKELMPHPQAARPPAREEAKTLA